MSDTTIEKSLLDLAEKRGTDATFCPSEVARALFPEDWREHMDAVRSVADELVQDQKLALYQKGERLTILPTQARGPIRLRNF